MQKNIWAGRCLALAGSTFAATGASAGGHLDVDDAGMLDPGQCQYETWYGRAGSAPAHALHFGPACRVGPVELGLNLDRYVAGDAHAFTIGPQVKWTYFGQAADATWSAAVSASITYDRTDRGRPGRQLVLPVTWRADSSLQIHLNVGADWTPVNGQRSSRIGLGGEWAFNDKVSLLAERNRALAAWTSRFGVRYSFTPLISVDVTVARTGPNGARGFFVGLNHEFSRP